MVESASPVQLIIILYDGAIQWLQMAKKEIETNRERIPPNWSDFSHQIDMTLKILTHLQESLNHEHAPDLSDRLFSLYEYMKDTVLKVNAYKKTEEIDNVIKLLRNLRSSWQEISTKK